MILKRASASHRNPSTLQWKLQHFIVIIFAALCGLYCGVGIEAWALLGKSGGRARASLLAAAVRQPRRVIHVPLATQRPLDVRCLDALPPSRNWAPRARHVRALEESLRGHLDTKDSLRVVCAHHLSPALLPRPVPRVCAVRAMLLWWPRRIGGDAEYGERTVWRDHSVACAKGVSVLHARSKRVVLEWRATHNATELLHGTFEGALGAALQLALDEMDGKACKETVAAAVY